MAAAGAVVRVSPCDDQERGEKPFRRDESHFDDAIHLTQKGLGVDFFDFGWLASCTTRKDGDQAKEKGKAEDGVLELEKPRTFAEWYENMWAKWEETNTLDFLSNLEIRPDGGLNEIDKLWGKSFASNLMRIWFALQLVAFIVYNVGYLFYNDIDMLQQDYGDQKGGFLLGAGTYVWVFGLFYDRKLMAKQLVAGMELFLLSLICFAVLVNIVMLFCKRPAHDFWRRTSQLFLFHLPLSSSFTAMKLLFYVNPWVLIQELLVEVSFLRKRIRNGHRLPAVARIIWFLLSRVVCLAVGVDAFLVKFREANTKYVSASSINSSVIIGTLVFLNQLLGVVNLSNVVRTRIFFFVFGGADCVISIEEKAKERFWNSMLVRQIWATHGWWKFTIIMLSFSDKDIQSLILREKYN